eukprot:TRINITY_DN17932_c0_g1_i1.p1 TRINITY_DN17932_c0_g1~~TRINITY_DN17932_c0_g1_i1.p1  ORF type:complete len:198 (+),score=71.99 TRINITY_DN17932_c0_g1_i1:144-737(+)
MNAAALRWLLAAAALCGCFALRLGDEAKEVGAADTALKADGADDSHQGDESVEEPEGKGGKEEGKGDESKSEAKAEKKNCEDVVPGSKPRKVSRSSHERKTCECPVGMSLVHYDKKEKKIKGQDSPCHSKYFDPYDKEISVCRCFEPESGLDKCDLGDSCDPKAEGCGGIEREACEAECFKMDGCDWKDGEGCHKKR